MLCVDDLVSRSLTILCQKLSVSLRKLCRWQQLDELSPASSCAMLLMASIASHTLLVIKHCWTTALEQEQIEYITGKACCLLRSFKLDVLFGLDMQEEAKQEKFQNALTEERSLLQWLGYIQHHSIMQYVSWLYVIAIMVMDLAMFLTVLGE